ncbi:hypothetical protein F2P81_016046 [Scophthalmus maximus]|uniref:Uncharacterized protein n=1 Tax=Scophthalmus maximus TaxID=52904 RepID=A0A6A4SK38_SCOMX|nr:hypothetical protein F2P81_016046 [Scophthalmus maximus]
MFSINLQQCCETDFLRRLTRIGHLSESRRLADISRIKPVRSTEDFTETSFACHKANNGKWETEKILRLFVIKLAQDKYVLLCSREASFNHSYNALRVTDDSRGDVGKPAMRLHITEVLSSKLLRLPQNVPTTSLTPAHKHIEPPLLRAELLPYSYGHESFMNAYSHS